MDSDLSSGLHLISLSNPIETLISSVLNETSSLSALVSNEKSGSSVLVRSPVRLLVRRHLWTNRFKTLIG